MSESINSAWPFGTFEDGEGLDVDTIFGNGTSESDVNPFDPPAVQEEKSAAPAEQPQAVEAEPVEAPAPQPKPAEPSVPQTNTQSEPVPEAQKPAAAPTEEPSNVIQAYFFCSGYRKNTDLCSAHYIREKIVEQLVLEGLQRLLWYVQVYEKQFAQEQMERFGLQEKRKLTAKRRELDRAKERVAEIDQLIQKSYEDMSKGLLSEERFATLTVSLENEQRQLKADIPEMESSLAATADKAADLQRFIERARQVTRLTKLTPEIVHEFIEKIVVSKPNKVDGKRYQTVDIHYNTIGLWVAPDLEELEREYLTYYKTMQKRRKKTA